MSNTPREVHPGLYRLYNLYIAIEPDGKFRAVAVTAAGVDGRGWQTVSSRLVEFATGQP